MKSYPSGLTRYDVVSDSHLHRHLTMNTHRSKTIYMEIGMLDQDSATFSGGAETDAAGIAKIAKAMAHPARVRIIAFLLSKPGCIGGDVVDQVGLAQSTVSEHLRILKAAGIVAGTIDYPRICYALDPAALAPLRALIEAIAVRPTEGDAACCHIPQTRASNETGE